MIAKLQRRKVNAHGRPTDVLNLFRALAMDTVTLYLFGQSFDSVGEDTLSATAFIDKYVAGCRFFYLPGWIYDFVDSATKFEKETSVVTKSNDIITQFTTMMIDRSMAEEKGEGKTY